MLSVVIPVYNEEAALPRLLAQVAAWRARLNLEVVFSDGGSTDATCDLLRSERVVSGAKGRGGQCMRGAAAATGDVLAFVHADVALDAAALASVEGAVAGGVRWGCLTLRWDRAGLIWRFGELMSNLRVRVGGIPFGDQAPFFDRALFEEVGGFPDIPIMEDYELALRLRARGLRPRQLPGRVLASPRRFVEGGPVRTALMMARLRRLYRQGTPPEELAKLYRDVRGGRDACDRCAPRAAHGTPDAHADRTACGGRGKEVGR